MRPALSAAALRAPLPAPVSSLVQREAADRQAQLRHVTDPAPAHHRRKEISVVRSPWAASSFSGHYKGSLPLALLN